MSSRWRRSSMRSRIWAWMVTSRAVVGSSAMSSLGSQASAMAIITRWRRPPESSWGYWSSRSAGWGISTSRRTSSARCRACWRETSRCSRTPSAIWRPMVMVGLSEVIGSWGMSATSLPRTCRMARLVQPGQVPAEQGDGPSGHVAGAGQQAHDGQPGGALAAPGLAHDADALALAHVESDAVDGHHGARPHAEFGTEILQLQDRSAHHRSVVGPIPTPGVQKATPSGRGEPAHTVRPACRRSVASTYSSTMEKTTSLAFRTEVARPMTCPQGLKFTSLACSG